MPLRPCLHTFPHRVLTPKIPLLVHLLDLQVSPLVPGHIDLNLAIFFSFQSLFLMGGVRDGKSSH